jgi:hypothetical protein
MIDREMVWESLPGIEEYLKHKLVNKITKEEGSERERDKIIKEFRTNRRSHSKYSGDMRSYENLICNFIVFVQKVYNINISWLSFLSLTLVNNYLQRYKHPKTLSNQGKMMCDIILFLRTNNSYIFNFFNCTGNYVYGNIGLIRPKLSEIRRYSSINKKEYKKKIKEGRSLTPTKKLELFSQYLNKMDKYMNGDYDNEDGVDDDDDDDDDDVGKKVMAFQNLLLPGNFEFSFLILI